MNKKPTKKSGVKETVGNKCTYDEMSGMVRKRVGGGYKYVKAPTPQTTSKLNDKNLADIETDKGESEEMEKTDKPEKNMKPGVCT